ncbi:MAG TPA: SRPBCC family protein [Bryobacteraceae bacterium]|nr:SRPBCC family protein [Bryobacteraceae bacterium]
MDTERRSTSLKPRDGGPGKLATGLGWFSIGLGAAELIAPERVAELAGLPAKDKSESVLRAYGWREIAAGIGILTQSRPAGWLWARVAGDAVDLASLGSCFAANGANRSKVTASTLAVAGVTALDVICARQLSRNGGANGISPRRTVHITQSVIVNRSPEELYGVWRDVANLPKFMRHIESVQVIDGGRLHWKMAAPRGKTIEWDSEIVEDQPNRRIAWRSVGLVERSGSIEFSRAAGGRGTIVRIDMEFAPPGGRLAAEALRRLRAIPAHVIGDALRAFKAFMETGEVVQSDASIGFGMHPGRPPAPEELAAAHYASVS